MARQRIPTSEKAVAAAWAQMSEAERVEAKLAAYNWLADHRVEGELTRANIPVDAKPEPLRKWMVTLHDTSETGQDKQGYKVPAVCEIACTEADLPAHVDAVIAQWRRAFPELHIGAGSRYTILVSALRFRVTPPAGITLQPLDE